MAPENIPAGGTEPDQDIEPDQEEQVNIPTKDPAVKEDKVDIKVDDLDSTDIRTPDTQGSNLPKLTQVIITNVPRRLKHNSKNPDQWILQVKFALAQLPLEHLLNSSVARPAKGHHNYNRWVQWSRTVANWLYLQLDERLQQRHQECRKIHSKADSLFDTIVKMARERENINARLESYHDSWKRSDSEVVRQYISVPKTHHLLGSNLLPISSLR
ncbi:hypothetical protein N7491_006470 [Penicillium cf. griseofulvum]|uniref:Uncharacterized protein n=1 Tax=Penicillium cf. griseofulvum TaxID=2972120 RepID=A0A9W9IVQ9_9EURO|nr:hypothetical protein N7472_010500 [Penicillium cf. griseofulvum]KAJ5429454.1 hypothetical protein N7491_006470 [Penicillium cf. griseofulvum]